MPSPDLTLAEMVGRALARPSDTPAIEFEGRWFTWGDLATIARDVCDQLDRAGVDPQAPVALVPRNRPSSVAALLGLLRQGRTVRMVYPFQSREAIAQAVIRHAVGAVLFDDTLLNDAGIAGPAHAGPAPDEPLIEVLTSGTTGPPKSFPIRHRMIAENLIGAASLDQDWSREPPALLYFPLGNITGIYSTIPALVRGQRACLLDRFSLPAWHDYVLRHRPTRTGIPPACMREMLDAGIPREDLASIQAMGVGAAPLDPALQREFEDRYGIPILLSYGATEFGGPVCGWTPELHAEWGRAKLGSVGRAIGGAQLRVAEGLLEVISPRIGPHWIRTSDLARIDQDGFLWLQGRADGAIMRGGFKILPETIEQALISHPAVAEAVVVGLPDPRLDQVPAAAVRLHPGAIADPAVLEAWLRRQLLATQIPAHWYFCDTMPLNPSMKIDRPALRRMIAENKVP